jgi:ribosomal protein S27AE
MNFHFHITIGKDGVSQSATSPEIDDLFHDKDGVSQSIASCSKVEFCDDKDGASQSTSSLKKVELSAEEGKINAVIKSIKSANEPGFVFNRDYFLNSVKEEIGKLANVNLFVKSEELSYTVNLLFHASRENCLRTVLMLLENGADPSLVNNKGISVLHLMAKRGQVEMAKKCYYKIVQEKRAHFVNNECPESGKTPLIVAAENNQYSFVTWLLAENAEANKKMTTGWTAMHAAAKINSAEIVRSLLYHDGNQDIRATHEDFSGLQRVKDVTTDPDVQEALYEYD